MSTLSTVLSIASPFIVGGLILAAIKLHEKYSNYRYRRAVEERNAKLVRHGMVPFKGTREYFYDDQH